MRYISRKGKHIKKTWASQIQNQGGPGSGVRRKESLYHSKDSIKSRAKRMKLLAKMKSMYGNNRSTKALIKESSASDKFDGAQADIKRLEEKLNRLLAFVCAEK